MGEWQAPDDQLMMGGTDGHAISADLSVEFTPVSQIRLCLPPVRPFFTSTFRGGSSRSSICGSRGGPPMCSTGPPGGRQPCGAPLARAALEGHVSGAAIARVQPAAGGGYAAGGRPPAVGLFDRGDGVVTNPGEV